MVMIKPKVEVSSNLINRSELAATNSNKTIKLVASDGKIAVQLCLKPKKKLIAKLAIAAINHDVKVISKLLLNNT